MVKNFDEWNKKKKEIDAKNERLFFKEGEIWWVNLGLNIGFETNGKGGEYMRPVLILRKYNQYSFLALPLSTVSKAGNDYYFPIGEVDDKIAFVVLSQLRNIDSKRLINKVGYLEAGVLLTVKQKTSQINFGLFS